MALLKCSVTLINRIKKTVLDIGRLKSHLLKPVMSVDVITAGMMNSPGMQSMMQQLMSNPQLMQTMMQSPMMTTMMQEMASNPSTAQQAIRNY